METFNPPIPLTTSRVSLYYLCLSVYRKIVTHPLLIAPLVRHPLTNEVVKIEKYKFKNGIELEHNKLCCSIFPHSTPTDGLSLPKPAETSLSAIFQQRDVGDEFDLGVYHIALKLHFNTPSVFIPHPDQTLSWVPDEAMVHYSQEGFINPNNYRQVELEMNPALPILTEYLELIRLALLDRQHKGDFPIPLRNMNVTYFNFKDGPWEKDRNVYFAEAELLIRMDISVGREWRQNLKNPDNTICNTFRVILGRE